MARIRLERDMYKPSDCVSTISTSRRVLTLPVTSNRDVEVRYCRRKSYLVWKVAASVLWNYGTRDREKNQDKRPGEISACLPT